MKISDGLVKTMRNKRSARIYVVVVVVYDAVVHEHICIYTVYIVVIVDKIEYNRQNLREETRRQKKGQEEEMCKCE